jgi:hypothetical protein
MPNMTLSIPEDVHKIIKKHSEIRWSEVARRSIVSEAEKLELMEKLVENSKLTPEDVREIDVKIKEGIFRRFEDALHRRYKHSDGGSHKGLARKSPSGKE